MVAAGSVAVSPVPANAQPAGHQVRYTLTSAGAYEFDLFYLTSQPPSMEAFNADHSTGYVGVSLAKLQASYDAGIKNVTIRVATNGGYCLENTLPGTVTYHKSGPSGDIKSGAC